MNLTDLFDLSFQGRREAVALEFLGKTYTFGDIDERSSRMANLLAQRGLTAGDRLCVYLHNSIEMIDVFLACTKLGIIFVPINVLYREREIAHILSDADPRATVTSSDGFPGPAEVWRPDELSSEAARLGTQQAAVMLDGDAPAALVYTSGTTGTSKGAILTHNNFIANALNLITSWQISQTDRLLLSLPLFHVHGLGNGLHVWLISGCRMKLLERFEHASATAEFLQFRPSLFFGVPTMYVRLLETKPDIAREIGKFMRLFVSGSAPLPAQVFEGFRQLFGHTILERYGMTETFMNISNPYVGERRPGTVGKPLPGVSVRLLDPAGKPAVDGATGELFVRGPNVFAGYWRRPEATQSSFFDGYFKTGDLAMVSSDGYYTLQGRKSDLIISGGFNIYPREIEEFLLEQACVSEAAVIGVPDGIRGEIPIAYVVPRGEFDARGLENRCRASLASFKIPRAFIPLQTLPRTALGKVQKHLLPNWTPASPLPDSGPGDS
jgi:malonyl-CoA/methylmalonyl-CoA synthetase